MAQALDLKDIKREQRRVAALLGHEVKTEPYNTGDITKRSNGVTFCICSGPDVAKNICGMHKNKRNTRLEDCHHPKHSLSSKRSKSVDAAEMLRLKRERENVLLRGQSITPQCRSPTIIKGLPNGKLHGKIKGKDIQDFDYRNLNGDVITDELGGPDSLPGIYHSNYNNAMRGLGVPDNSPRTTARRKKSTKLPNIEGTKNHRAIIQVSVNGHQRHNTFVSSDGQSEDNLDVFTMENGYSENQYRNNLKGSDYCQCTKPEMEITLPNSNSSGYQTDSTQNIGLEQCLKCGKILKIPKGNGHTASGGDNLQQYFDPHASMNDEGINSFISRQNTIDSVSSTSFVRITDEFSDFSDSEEQQNRNASKYHQQKTKETKKKANVMKDNFHPGTLPECSEDEVSDTDYHEYLYNIKKQETPTSESLKLNLHNSSMDGLQNTNDKTPKKKYKKKLINTRVSNFEIYEDGHKEAYIKALAMAQIPKLPEEAWMLSARISRSHDFSYFDPFTYGSHCKTCDQYLLPNNRPKVDNRTRKIKPKKHIFGNLEVDDFYPGGKRNPLEMRRKYEQNSQH